MPGGRSSRHDLHLAGDANGDATDAAFATVAGGTSNLAGAKNATVCGGYGNQATAPFATICGGGRTVTDDAGTANRVTDAYATVGGGGDNLAGNENSSYDDARGATVAGGLDNRATQAVATVGGGASNKADGAVATVGGGGGEPSQWPVGDHRRWPSQYCRRCIRHGAGRRQQHGEWHGDLGCRP